MQKDPNYIADEKNISPSLEQTNVIANHTTPQSGVSSDKLIQEAYDSLISDFRQHYARNNRIVTEADVELIDKAFQLANGLHEGMFRKSGEPYILHPIEVARIIVNEIGLETVSVVCSLLHDVVEDTNITVADLQRDFGYKIAHIVDGLTKIRTVLKDKNKQSLLVNTNTDSEETQRAETVRREMIEKADNIRKIIMTLGDDIRVIIIKIADRLHNMRTMDSMPPKKQRSISDETLFFYAPIAHRLGLYAIKSELEDLCLKYTANVEYKEIARKLEAKKNERERYIKDFIEPIKQRIEEKGEIKKFRIFGRPKHIYSIYNKIHTKNVPFEDIFDLFAIRIVIDCPPDYETEHHLCWSAFHAVTWLYPHYKPERLRDWVTKPKSNGYESLHVTVMNSDGRWVEIQIRTERMDTIAEKGVAAHWIYKDSGTNNKPAKTTTSDAKNTKNTPKTDTKEIKLVRKGKNKNIDQATTDPNAEEEDNKNATAIKGFNDWLNEIREQLKDNSKSSIELVTDVRHTLYEQEIFVFSPKGKVLTLKKGATVLDFAFAIHTDLGCTCIGGKIDGKLYPISYKLKNGEQVEIITSKKAKPTPEWLNFAVTSKARNKIKSHINYEKEQSLRENAKTGEEMLQRRLTNNFKVKFSNDIVNELQVYFKYKDSQDFLASIGAEQFDWNRLKELKIVGDRFVFPSKDNKTPLPLRDEVSLKGIEDQDVFQGGISIFEGFADRIDYGTAQCCNAQPGDVVYGFLTIGNGIKIHRTNCPNAPDHHRYPYRIVNIKWSKNKDLLYLLPVFIKGIDDVGVVNRISNLISGELKLNMRSISFDSTDGIFEGKIEVYVATEAQGKQLMKRLKSLEGIHSVDQIKRD